MVNHSEDFDWRKSPAHLDLLDKFTKGRDVAQVMDWQYVKEQIREPTKSAIDRFVKEGVLVPSTLEEKLARLLTVDELKDLLRDRGLKVSGRKAALIRRFVQADRPAAEDLTHGHQIMKCSDEALALLEAFEQEREQAKREAKSKSSELLLAGNPQEAYREFLQYARQYASPDARSSTYQVEALDDVLSVSPDALSDLSESNLRHLQAAAAMSILWHDENAISWLPEDFTTAVRGTEVAVNYLKRAAEFRDQISRMGDYASGVRLVFSPYDVDSCELCKKLDGQEFTKDEIPNLPLKGCTSHTGCQCKLEYIWDREETDLESPVTVVTPEDEGEIVADDPVFRLATLKVLFDTGLITQEKYNAAKKQVLDAL